MFGRWIWLLAACLLAAGCGTARPAAQSQAGAGAPARLKLAATIFPLADWLRQIGGEHVEVHLLVSGAINPHHFEPTPRDAVQIASSRALFSIGLGLDPWAARLARGAGSSVEFFQAGTWIVPRKFGGEAAAPASSAASASAADHPHEGSLMADVPEGEDRHESGSADPHFWHDPKRVMIVVARMAGELARMDPAHAADYQAAAAKYIERLKVLDAEVVALAARIPPRTQLVAFHDAYGYLFERLGITLAGVVQASPGIEPGLKDIARAVRTMQAIGQKSVFSGPQENAAAAERIAREIGGHVELLDSMDIAIGVDSGGYIERFRGNLQRLEQGLK